MTYVTTRWRGKTFVLSLDGRHVGFYSTAPDLVGFDGNAEDDIFGRGPLR